MRIYKQMALVAALILPLCGAGQLFGQELTPVERHVRHELITLPFYNVFDWFDFKVDGGTVTLMGEVTTPTLKTSAERVVERVEGVQKVINNIEVLPVSPNDDRIRLEVYRAIYYNPNFTKYAIRAVPPIHILVKNGDVRLMGVVASAMDKQIAGIQVNGVPGVFSVTNDLTVENER